MDRTRLLLIVALVVVVGGGGAYYKFVLSAPEEVTATQATDANCEATAGAPDVGSAPTDTTAGTTVAPDPAVAAAAAAACNQSSTASTDLPVPNPPSADPTATGATPPAATPPAAPASNNPLLVVQDNVSGNNSYGVTLSRLVATVALKNSLTFAVDTQLIPAKGGLTFNKALLRKYRPTVVAAVMRITITDPTTLQQWTTSSKAVRRTAVNNYLNLLGKLLSHASRSVTFVGSENTVLAIGDSKPGSKSAIIRIF